MGRDTRRTRLVLALLLLTALTLVMVDDRTSGAGPLGGVRQAVADVLGPGFTAKNFRTWRGSVIAARSLALADASTATARKRAVSSAMKETAGHLGNTPAVARSSFCRTRPGKGRPGRARRAGPTSSETMASPSETMASPAG